MVFKEWLAHSIIPEDWGWYEIWKGQGILMALDRFWEIWEVGLVALSDWRKAGIPNQGMTFWRRSETV